MLSNYNSFYIEENGIIKIWHWTFLKTKSNFLQNQCPLEHWTLSNLEKTCISFSKKWHLMFSRQFYTKLNIKKFHQEISLFGIYWKSVKSSWMSDWEIDFDNSKENVKKIPRARNTILCRSIWFVVCNLNDWQTILKCNHFVIKELFADMLNSHNLVY